MESVAIVGPGLMGLGIARVCARAGMHVHLMGRDAGSAARARDRLASELERQVKRGRLPEADAQSLLGYVHAAGGWGELAQCGIAVESVPEDRATKLDVLHRLEAVLPHDALIATNTSGLPVGGLAASLRAPGRFLGLHFFSPVDRMPLVEVVRGVATDAATLDQALRFVRSIGHTPVMVRDGPGFFTSRVFAAYLDEAVAMVGEGVDAQRIEQAALELGRPIGPLALMDDISLALNLQQAQQARADGLPPERCRPLAEPVLAALVGIGRKGRRDGGGFYEDAGEGRRVPWKGLADVFSPARQQPTAQRIAERLRCAEVLEALRCVEEDVIDSADDADVASVLGLGFPRATGGVLRWAESQGLGRLVATCDVLAAECGARFAPSNWLRARAVHGHLAPWRAPVTPLERSP